MPKKSDQLMVKTQKEYLHSVLTNIYFSYFLLDYWLQMRENKCIGEHVKDKIKY